MEGKMNDNWIKSALMISIGLSRGVKSCPWRKVDGEGETTEANKRAEEGETEVE